ncbi:MAG TPA: hypothetical protein VEL76_19110 [Gemmataceae bacterium]|nr:hypothetical protein [Gemmataceae bacterium]
MTRIVVTSKVGSDGVLHLTLPLEDAIAGQDVRVTVEPVAGPAPTPEEWRRAVLATAGQWQGDFERPPQGDYEEREPLS